MFLKIRAMKFKSTRIYLSLSSLSTQSIILDSERSEELVLKFSFHVLREDNQTTVLVFQLFYGMCTPISGEKNIF